ncbi:MAG: hypothetical protein JXA54_13875 [Candidatus Heimdallarchaeota archaeon]|nr:hypothetical protein [Candidatus Heimdallarchaeota archaeon]
MTEENVKFCEACGNKNDKKAKFCNSCGKSFEKQTKTATKEDNSSFADKGSGLEVVSLVSSILGFTCFPIIGLIVAIITGLLAPNPKGNKYSKAGISIGSLGLIALAMIPSLVGIIFCLVSIGNFHDDFMWVPILSVIGLIASGVALFFFIRWMKKPSS